MMSRNGLWASNQWRYAVWIAQIDVRTSVSERRASVAPAHWQPGDLKTVCHKVNLRQRIKVMSTNT